MDEIQDPMFDDERDEELAALVMLEAEEYVEHKRNDDDEIAEAIYDA